MTKINPFVCKIRESVPKQELEYNSKSSNKAQKLPAYSAEWSEKQRCSKTLFCIENIGENAIWVQIHVTLQF